MTRKEYQQIQNRLDSLERELKRLRAEGSHDFPVPAHEFEDLPQDAIVEKDYVAWRFGISERAVLRGEGGTNRIRRVSKKPLKFIRREVDAAWKEKIKPKAAQAAEVRAGKKLRRYSLLGKSRGTKAAGESPVKAQALVGDFSPAK